MSNLLYITETKHKDDVDQEMINMLKPEISLIKTNTKDFKFYDHNTNTHYKTVIINSNPSFHSFVCFSFKEIKMALKDNIKFGYLIVFVVDPKSKDSNETQETQYIKYRWDYNESDLLVDYNFYDIQNVRVLTRSLKLI